LRCIGIINNHHYFAILCSFRLQHTQRRSKPAMANAPQWWWSGKAACAICFELSEAKVSQKVSNYCWWKKSCTSWYGKNPIIYRVLYIPGGAGFLPSTIMRALIWEVYFHFPLYFNTVHLYVWTDSLIFSSPGVRVDPYDVKHLTVTPVIKWSYSWGSLNIKVFHAMSLNPFWVTTSPTPRSHRNAGSESFHWEMLL